MTRILAFAALTSLFWAVHSRAAEEPLAPPIEALKVSPDPSIFEATTRQKPLQIKSADEAAKYFSEESLATLKEKVDFEKQFVLVFAWRGSGQDKLDYAVAESFPEQISFSYRPGRTRDIRPHIYVYALRSDVSWKAP